MEYETGMSVQPCCWWEEMGVAELEGCCDEQARQKALGAGAARKRRNRKKAKK